MPEETLRFTDMCKVLRESAEYIAMFINKEKIPMTHNECVSLDAGRMLFIDDMEHSLDIVAANPLILKNREHIIVSLMLIAEKLRGVDDPAFVNDFHICCLEMIQKIRDKNYD
jgi:hypothetical protein